MDWLKQHVEGHGGQVNFYQILLTLAFATTYSYIIAFVYSRTYSGKKYAANFAHSIILLGVLVSLVIAIIGNSVARAFGVFGALSIIRYRVPIRDPKDITFVLASVVVGLACGVQEYPEAGLATLFLVVLVTLMYRFSLGINGGTAGPADHSDDTLDSEDPYDDDLDDEDGFEPPKKKKDKHKDKDKLKEKQHKADREKHKDKPDKNHHGAEPGQEVTANPPSASA